jgi:hypothetical protein
MYLILGQLEFYNHHICIILHMVVSVDLDLLDLTFYVLFDALNVAFDVFLDA